MLNHSQRVARSIEAIAQRVTAATEEKSDAASGDATSIDRLKVTRYKDGLALRDDEKARLQADLGEANNLILRNHGLLTCGATVADAFLNMFILQRACEVQIAAQSGGAQLIPIAQPMVEGIKAAAAQVTRGLGGNIAWPALLRKLDREQPDYKN